MTATGLGGRLLIAAVVVGLVSAAPGLATAASSQSAAPSPSITIAVGADGSAEWTVVNTVELSTETDRSTFDELATNETYKQQLLADTVWAYRAVANGTSERLGREMAVEARGIELRREDSTGVVAVTFQWSGFARTDGERVLVGDAFAGGYPLAADRTLTIEGPEGYRLTGHNVSTADATVSDRAVTWEGPATVGSSIELTYERATPSPTPTATPISTPTATPTAASTARSTGSPTPTATPTGAGSPGFGVPVAVLALVAGVLLVRRRS